MSSCVQGGPRKSGEAQARERWPESSGRGLDDDFLVEAFFCQVWSFSVRLQVAPGGVKLRPRRFQEANESPEHQNGGLRALEESSMTNS